MRMSDTTSSPTKPTAISLAPRSRRDASPGSILTRQKPRPAAELVRANRKTLADNIARWTGVQRPIVKRLLESVEARAAEFQISADRRSEAAHLIDLVAYTSVLALRNLKLRTTSVRPRAEKPRARGEALSAENDAGAGVEQTA